MNECLRPQNSDAEANIIPFAAVEYLKLGRLLNLTGEHLKEFVDCNLAKVRETIAATFPKKQPRA